MRIQRICSGVVAAAALLAACDTSVTNPGPTPDDELNNPLAYSAIIVGARLALARSYGSDATNGGQLAYWGAALAFEINPAGSTGSFGLPTLVQAGVMTAPLSSDDWDSANQARFVAEDALRRFAAVAARDSTKKARPTQIAQAALYAGYANRALGENFCGAVLPIVNPDGSLSAGDSTPHTDYFLRAEQHFTNAIQQTAAATGSDTVLGATVRTAARAGRASVRLDLASWGVTSPGVASVAAQWDSAAADAAAITNNAFVFQLPYSDQDQNQYNYIFWSSANSPYRAHTQWGTFYEGYFRASKAFLASGDTRVRWDSLTNPATGDAAVTRFGGTVPWWPERKHGSRTSPINLSSGWEMRLVQAERALVSGNAGAAVGFMNQRRTQAPLAALPDYDPTVTLDSAWTLLKTERAIELWLEARRLGDLRRWIRNSVPGRYPDGLYRLSRTDSLHTFPQENMTSPVQRSLCFPIGQSELDTNPNYP